MPTTVTFVPGRKKNQRNPVIDGHRFTKDRSRNGNTYYKCTLFKDGCRARITLNEDDSLVTTRLDSTTRSRVSGPPLLSAAASSTSSRASGEPFNALT